VNIENNRPKRTPDRNRIHNGAVSTLTSDSLKDSFYSKDSIEARVQEFLHRNDKNARCHPGVNQSMKYEDNTNEAGERQ
jgi:hypothetical protein